MLFLNKSDLYEEKIKAGESVGNHVEGMESYRATWNAKDSAFVDTYGEEGAIGIDFINSMSVTLSRYPTQALHVCERTLEGQ